MMNRPTFKKFLQLRETAGDKDWRTTSARQLEPQKGFIPPPPLRPIIRAFLNSDKIVLMGDTGGKPVTMPKKTLYLVGGPVRDHVHNALHPDKPRSIKDLDLATNATPEQIATILSSAGFKRSDDKGTPADAKPGEKPAEGLGDLKLPGHAENADGKQIKFEPAGKGDNMTWYVKGRDNSKDRKPFVIGAKVDGTEFDIATFRKDAKVTDGKAEVEFTDNPKDDAARRDLTINAMYIELSKPDSANNTVYDPTGHGMYHLPNGIVKTVGKAEDRFEEDPLRVLRAIAFTCKFGKTKTLDPDIKRAIAKFKNLGERIAPDRIRGEFIKRLLDPEVDISKYIDIFKETGYIEEVFPGIKVGSVASIPEDFSGRNDKTLALAWMLQNNPPEAVEKALASKRQYGGEEKETGWQTQERRAIKFLLKLKEFTPERVSEFLREREGTGLTAKQVRDWVDLVGHKMPNKDHARKLADYRKQVSWDHVENTPANKCPHCHGHPLTKDNCPHCRGSGQLPEKYRSQVLGKLEAEKFNSQK